MFMPRCSRPKWTKQQLTSRHHSPRSRVSPEAAPVNSSARRLPAKMNWLRFPPFQTVSPSPTAKTATLTAISSSVTRARPGGCRMARTASPRSYGVVPSARPRGRRPLTALSRTWGGLSIQAGAAMAADGLLRVGDEVRTALRDRRPVVALESTLITHGLPWPTNLETARAAEDAVRRAGAVPATVAVWEGRPVVGVEAATVEALARAAEEGRPVLKASRRDLAAAVAGRATASTT